MGFLEIRLSTVVVCTGRRDCVGRLRRGEIWGGVGGGRGEGEGGRRKGGDERERGEERKRKRGGEKEGKRETREVGDERRY